MPSWLSQQGSDVCRKRRNETCLYHRSIATGGFSHVFLRLTGCLRRRGVVQVLSETRMMSTIKRSLPRAQPKLTSA